MTQSAAVEVNRFPNLIELIGRHGGLRDSESWCGPAIGIDEVVDGIQAPRDNFLQDDTVNHPVDAMSISGGAAIGQDEVGGTAFAHDAIGQDEIPGGPGVKSDVRLISGNEAIGQDEDPAIGGNEAIGQDESPSIGASEVIGQDEIDLPAPRLHGMSICTGEAIGQDEIQFAAAAKFDAATIYANEVIGQDERPDAPSMELDAMSICNDEVLLQDEATITALG